MIEFGFINQYKEEEFDVISLSLHCHYQTGRQQRCLQFIFLGLGFGISVTNYYV